MNLTNDQANAIIKEGRDYLCEFDGIDNDIIDRHLNNYQQRHAQLNNLPAVYSAILDSARNRRHLPNVINNEVFNNLNNVLHEFVPNSVIEQYQNNPEMVFHAIAPEGTPHEPTNTWVQFSKYIISAANFLTRFDNFQQFVDFINAFTNNPITRVGLPLLLAEQNMGFGFALACDFIKENISPHYVKPDTHINHIFRDSGMSRSIASDFEIFKDVIDFSRIAEQVPYTVDKLFWLIGSGKFYLDNIKIRTNRQDFIERIKKILQNIRISGTNN
jgi:hypothetical protein